MLITWPFLTNLIQLVHLTWSHPQTSFFISPQALSLTSSSLASSIPNNLWENLRSLAHLDHGVDKNLFDLT